MEHWRQHGWHIKRDYMFHKSSQLPADHHFPRSINTNSLLAFPVTCPVCMGYAAVSVGHALIVQGMPAASHQLQACSTTAASSSTPKYST
jgi:hypothetical protein